jgi:hypothetical protein
MIILNGYKIIDRPYIDKVTKAQKQLSIIELHCSVPFNPNDEPCLGVRSVVELIPITQANLAQVKSLKLPLKIDILSEKNYSYKDGRTYNTGFVEAK